LYINIDKQSHYFLGVVACAKSPKSASRFEVDVDGDTTGELGRGMSSISSGGGGGVGGGVSWFCIYILEGRLTGRTLMLGTPISDVLLRVLVPPNEKVMNDIFTIWAYNIWETYLKTTAANSVNVEILETNKRLYQHCTHH
jgi:hypothetical protein